MSGSYFCCTGAAGQLDADSSVGVGGVPMMRPAGSDWDSGSFSSSGQSPLNGRYYSSLHCMVDAVFVLS